ncbi:MAG: 23S rRNA (guanosine(2251)-2'-O)-methyltransferase RlmB [Actinomycetota bacterium]
MNQRRGSGGSGRSGGRGGANTRGGGKSQGQGRGAQGGGRGKGGGRPNDRRGSARRNDSGGRRSGQRGTTPMRDAPTPGASGGSRVKGLGGDQVEGRHAVRELLLADTRRTREIIFAGDLDPAPILEEIVDLADEAKVPIRSLSRSKFESLARTDAPQGVVAMAAPIQGYELEDLVRRQGPTAPFLLVLDGVTDPQNLGSILRVAECAGVTGVVLPRHRAARITASVTKSAAGAVEHLRLCHVAGVPSALQRLRELEVWTVGLDMVAETTVFDLRVATDPVALVLGAEGSGISRLARERCDVVARIPLHGSLGSLNVSTAAAVACYEVVRRRDQP